MKTKLKLTGVQIHKLESAHGYAGEVLYQIKQKPLKGAALVEMQMLEDAVQNLETLSMILR